MSENQTPDSCNRNCSSCASNCGERTHDFRIQPHEKSKIKKIIGVVSGKGGVGKSFVTSVLASTMSRKGYHVGVLDGDITGPSMGKVFGIHEKASGQDNMIFPAVTKTGIQVITTNMLLDSDSQPIIWRGPMVAGILKQFYQEVYWHDVDYLFVDMPPGTSDLPLTLFQSIPLDGIVVVTTPQELVSMVVEKAINMAKMMNVKILGLIENMSYVECDECGHKMYVFGQSHIDQVAQKYNLDVLAKIPLNPKHVEYSDQGNIEDLEVKEIEDAISHLENI